MILFQYFVIASLYFPSLTYCNCRRVGRKSESSLTVYWINLDRSVERRVSFSEQMIDLQIRNMRIPAITPSNLKVPSDVGGSRQDANYAKCQFETNQTFEMTPNSDQTLFFIAGLCGRPKNTLKELAVTVSHLYAIYTALNTNDTSKYAIIAEDDVLIPFDVDYDSLILSAPKDFAILQLLTSNDKLLKRNYKTYLQNGTYLWKPRENHHAINDYWCAGFYIIKKEYFSRILNTIITPINSKAFRVKVIAGYEDKGCVPSECCEVKDKIIRRKYPPCVHSPRGYSADHFIYSLFIEQTYMITVPFITSATAANQSTLHQEQVGMHATAFDSINRIISSMKKGKSPMPNFTRPLTSDCT